MFCGAIRRKAKPRALCIRKQLTDSFSWEDNYATIDNPVYEEIDFTAIKTVEADRQKVLADVVVHQDSRSNYSIESGSSGVGMSEKMSSGSFDSQLSTISSTSDFRSCKGQLRLSLTVLDGKISVHVHEARYKSRNEKSTRGSYVQVFVCPDGTPSSVQQTQVVKGGNHPVFDERMLYCLEQADRRKRLTVVVWQTGESQQSRKMVGCLSFGLRHLMASSKKTIEGWYWLLPEQVGYRKHLLVTSPNGSISTGYQTASSTSSLDKSSTFVLKRSSSGFGFTLKKGTCPVQIGRVKEGGAADLAGLLTGQAITHVNALCVVSFPAETVVKMIRESGSVLVIKVLGADKPAIHSQESSESLQSFPDGKSDDHCQDENTPPQWNPSTINSKIRSAPCMTKDYTGRVHKRRDSNSLYSKSFGILGRKKQAHKIIRRSVQFVDEEIISMGNHTRRRSETKFVSLDRMDTLTTISSQSEWADEQTTMATSCSSNCDWSVDGTSDDESHHETVPGPAEKYAKWNPDMSPIAKNHSRYFSATMDETFSTSPSFAQSTQDSSNISVSDFEIRNLSAMEDSPAEVSHEDTCQKSTNQTSQSGSRDQALHDLMQLEQLFVDQIAKAVQQYSRPLRHCLLSAQQHNTLFQNVEKLAALSRLHVQCLREVTSPDSQQAGLWPVEKNAVGSVYLPRLQLLCDAYETYCQGLASAFNVLDQMKKVDSFTNIIMKLTDEKEGMTLVEFLAYPVQHYQYLLNCLRTITELTPVRHHDATAIRQILAVLQNSHKKIEQSWMDNNNVRNCSLASEVTSNLSSILSLPETCADSTCVEDFLDETSRLDTWSESPAESSAWSMDTSASSVPGAPNNSFFTSHLSLSSHGSLVRHTSV